MRLFLLGFLTLFLELTLIRYLAGNIWNLGFFPNLVLMGAFVGMGTGFVCHHMLSTRASTHVFDAVAFVLLALILLVQLLHPSVPGFEAASGEIGGEIFFSSTTEKATTTNFLLFGLWLLTVVAIFAMISQYTAKLFAQLAPLQAYSLDIAGSCAGIVAFTLMSWAGLAAAAWFAACIPLLVLARSRGAIAGKVLTVVAMLAAVGVVLDQDRRLLRDPGYDEELVVTWSPYQKIEFTRPTEGAPFVFVNGIAHQALHRPEMISRLFYQAPYDHREKRTGSAGGARVLIIGAGTGNDVTAALMNDAGAVDAVEIDPVIAELGRRFHPAKPYDDPRVRLIVGDGRAVLTNADQRYDLIVFALTDSLVKASPMAQLRLENYIFTREAIERAFELLSDDGTLAFYNYYRRPWIVAKLERAILEATATKTTRISGWGDLDVVLVDRDGERADLAAKTTDASAAEPATDDWPFPYVRERGLPPIYAWAMLIVAAYTALLFFLVQRSAASDDRLRRGGGRLSLKLAFALMGVAFLLLETKSIIQFSLLFGTTWLNNSMVFLTVLLLVLAANWTAFMVRGAWLLRATFPLLIASSLLPLAYPLSNLLYVDNAMLRFVAAGLLTFSPVFFANLLFSIAFRDQEVAEHMFGWNLFGATLGGILEYSSMVLGYNALSVIVALCYAGAFGLLMAGRERGEVATIGAYAEQEKSP